MSRCIQLAALGAGFVAPNPMVGAVLVYNNRIIGEGYHQKYGEAHAEVNCIASVKEEDRQYVPQSVLYVSLEPCAHYGKTPPCADLIIKNKIPKVIIGCRDPFKEVNGKGIEKLKAANIEVESGVLENECKELNKRFFTFHTKHRPYIILKWAQTNDARIASLNPSQGGTLESSDSEPPFSLEDSKIPPPSGGDGGGRLLISNEYSNRLVHKWRSEEAAILVGTNTALLDNPELTTRLWNGASPTRLIIDMDLRLPGSLKIFNQQVRTIIFNKIKHSEDSEWFNFPSLTERGQEVRFYQVTEDVSIVPQVINALYHLRIQSVIVEGGAKLLQSFIDEESWDEARIITNTNLIAGNGLRAPELKNAKQVSSSSIQNDTINIYIPSTN